MLGMHKSEGVQRHSNQRNEETNILKCSDYKDS